MKRKTDTALRAFVERLLNPSDLGHAATPEIRDAAREALGLPAVETTALATARRRAQWVEQVMEQAQVFASAWSLVGGPFDAGDGLELANEEKAQLRALVAQAPVHAKEEHGVSHA